MSTVYMTLFSCSYPKPLPAFNGKKTVIITGANRGIGLSAAKMLAKTNEWKLILACRSTEKAHDVRLSLENMENVEVLQLDLSDLNSVKAFAAQWGARRLDCLALNAGIHTGDRSLPLRSAQGFEATVATNHLGHFKLMKMLLPNIERSAGRIVFVASSVHDAGVGKCLLGDLSGLISGFKSPESMIDGSTFNSDKAYRDSKLCNVLITRELSRRLSAGRSGATCICLSPGLIPTTGLFREYNPYLVSLFSYFMNHIVNIAVSEEEGGRRLAYCIASVDLARANGTYFARSKLTNQFQAVEPSDEALDKDKAKKLWELSELLIS